MNELPIFFDRQGQPITMTEFERLHSVGAAERERNLRVAKTIIGPLFVSTVWLGIDYGLGMGPPLIFETMVFPVNRNEASVLHPELAEWLEAVWRYPTEGLALAGHDKVCVDLRVLQSNIEMSEQVEREAIAHEQRKRHNDRP
jgi:hypothetical protein